MTTTTKMYSFLLICLFIKHNSAISEEVFFDEDKPYEVLDFQVSQDLWKMAMRPTPILKSPVTIVVPVHVPPDEDEPIDTLENEIVTEATDLANPATVSAQEVSQDTVVAETPVVADVTVKPQAEAPAAATVAPAAAQPVNGSLYRFPCICRGGQCGCCTGAFLDRFQTRACGNITFIPEDFIFDVRLSINGNNVMRRRVSASNPPPICFNPRRAPFVEICAEISNIRIQNRNAFACLDINADIGGFPIYSASFRCFGLGASGLQTGLKPKPVSSGPAPVNLYGNNDDEEGGGGFIESAAGAVLGTGVAGELFGGGGDDDDDDDDGPLDVIGDAVGDFFEK